MAALRVILWDQLSKNISSLKGYDKETDTILLCESLEDATYVKHHKKKLVFLFSAMRHFAGQLKERGYNVLFYTLDNPDKVKSYKDAIKHTLDKKLFKKIVVTYPGEYRVLQDINSWAKAFNCDVDILEDERFLCSREDFKAWESDRKQLRMEYFYRTMRTKYHILMDGDQPVGGKWNYDADNRKFPKEELAIPKPYRGNVDAITKGVMAIVGEKFRDHFGDVEPFYLAINRTQALYALKVFISERLSKFGDFQDAMLEDEPWMFHSHLSFYINCGLLDPLECVKAAEQAYYDGLAPLNAVEGFIRQIMGWREYVHGIYWLKMPDYAHQNFLEAKRELPEFYWSGNTKMNCLRQCVLETKQNAYAHHIQRLMVLGNFALIAGIDPKYVNEWFLIVYADAYQWVELPNVTGMILFADGGFLGSKPYAAGGSYINKMSNYCKKCSYSVTKKNGPKACPFNYLYWDFLVRNRSKIQNNPRISMMFKTYDRMDNEKKDAIALDSKRFLEHIND